MRPSDTSEGSVWCCPVLGLLCCRRDPMGAGLSQTQVPNPVTPTTGPDGALVASQAAQPITMAEVVRERKRKMNGGLATLRRRLLAGRRGARGPRSSDPAAPLRDLLREWSPIEVGALLEEYEALAALRDLCVQAELARPPAAALRGDLAMLYDHRICPDAELIFKGSCFPVHRAILSARCPYFRELLNGYPSVGARVCLDSPLPPQVDTAALDGLLRFLYAGEPAPQPCDGESCDPSNRRRQASSVPDCCPNLNDAQRSQHGRLTLDVVSANGTAQRHARGPEPAMLRRLAQELGAQPAALHRDMRHLLDTAEFADASLVFTWEPPAPPPAAPPAPEGPQPAQQNSWDYGFRPRLELPCHRAVLSARSPFFRSVIQRRCRQQSGESSSTVKIVLDERVIPHKYARVLLHAVYTDQVDLNLVMRGGGSIFGCSILASHGSSLGEAQALTGNQQSATACARSNSSGNVTTHAPSPLEEAMELYEIGRFLELDILSQGCEDIIAERLSASSLAAVLKWSSQPHGSRWVHRQALRFLREEFLSVAAGPALLQLEAAHLQHALRCPFLQASELDALRAALRWGEHRLAKRMEDREPNLLSHTAHSVTRKGVKKRDLSDTELRELLADTLPLVRTDHVLPPNSELLTQAIRRGLVSSPPSCMLGDAPVSRADAWIRGKGNGGVYIRPRLYMPYYEEVKALLEDQMVQETELVRMRRARYIPDIPDTLYMVSAEPRARSSASVAAAESPRGAPGAAAAAAAPLAPAAPPAPSPQLLRALLSREAELRRAPACVRATSRALTHTHEVNRQIRLRVVREFNLPDSVADTLEGAAADGGASTPQQHAARSSQDGDDTDAELDEIGNRRCLQNSRDGLEPWCASPVGGRRPLPALLTEGDKSRPLSVESVVTRQRRRQIQNGRGLSEAMPDVAMATSSLTRLRIGQSEPPCRKAEPPEGFRYAEDPAKDTDGALQSSYHAGGALSYSLGRDERKQPSQGVAVTPQSGLNLNMFHNREATSYADCATSYAADTSPCVSGDRQMYACDGRSPCVDGRGIYDRAVYSSLVADGRYGPVYGKERPTDPVVPFMNPNQHLLQEGCGFGAYGRPARESRRRNHAWSSGQNQGDPASSYQHSELEPVPALQLDLGDGNQHSSPARHPEASQSWTRSQPHDRGGTLPADYGHSQYAVGCHPSPSSQARQCASYSRYLSASAGVTPGNPAASQAGGASAGGSASVTAANNPVYGMNPAASAGITAASNPMYGMNPTGFSTLQHHGRSRSPRAPPGHATLQRPRPVCPLTKGQPAERDGFAGQPQGGAKAVPLGNSLSRMKSVDCATNVSNCAAGNASCAVVSSCAAGSAGNYRPSNPGGSVAGTPSCAGEREVGVHRSHSAGSVASIGSDAERRDTKSAVHNVSGFNHQLPLSSAAETAPSPRHFRSLYSLPDPPYGRSPREYYASLRMSPFQESLQYSRGESPFACIQQQPPASRGESPLYTAVNSSSRGSSPFRALDSTPTQQFTRTSSPYSSAHRSEYRLSENYRSSSPGCRAYPAAANQRNSPSLKQPTANARLSASPSSACLQSKSRNSPIPNFSQSSLKLQRANGDQKTQQKACEGQKAAEAAPKGPRAVTSSPSCSSVNSFSRQDSSSRPPSRETEYFKQYRSSDAAPRYL